MRAPYGNPDSLVVQPYFATASFLSLKSSFSSDVESSVNPLDTVTMVARVVRQVNTHPLKYLRFAVECVTTLELNTARPSPLLDSRGSSMKARCVSSDSLGNVLVLWLSQSSIRASPEGSG